ncbi:ricin-type beta-trefoil lectin domain protein, partial [Roseisolibacter sp. H3M3-2]|uniref:ricin-type beta-trefoil lectin domain protein n=1 Tax=Roseisolibacter sp. H3M3-2 TaxID=3031323 RepID=UPI0023D99702
MPSVFTAGRRTRLPFGSAARVSLAGALLALAACADGASAPTEGRSALLGARRASASLAAAPGSLPSATGQGCLQPTDGAIAGGNTVEVAPCGGATQEWAVAGVGVAGEASPGGSHCLDALGGAPGTTLAIIWCQGTASQQWTLTAAGELRSAGGLCATFVAAG